MPVPIMWFRRDLRLSDHPALIEAVKAARGGGAVVAAFVLDDRLWRPAGDNRRTFLAGCLRSLDADLGGHLVVRHGDPVQIIPALAEEVGATEVFVTADFGPYGARRDHAVAAALGEAGSSLRRVGSPYAVPPGTLRTGAGGAYRVFTPFSKAWTAHGWPGPSSAPSAVPWATEVPSDAVPDAPPLDAILTTPGEQAAKRAARRFWDTQLHAYDERRDDPGADATSRLSPYLKWGCLHPRQLLHKLGTATAERKFRTELCWREFYADVLHHRPATARTAFDARMADMEVDGRGTASALRRVVPRVEPATRSSTPACASSSLRAGCTTGCACSSPASS